MCILMVEDESLILEIVAETLDEAGYNVVTALDGPSAAALVESRGHEFSALVSDFHLPGGLNGLDLARVARARQPDLPVILATGRPDLLTSPWQLTHAFVLLQKPYRPSEMLRELSRLVHPHRAPRGDGQNDFSNRSM